LYVAGLLGWLGFQPFGAPYRSEYASDGDKGWFFSYGDNTTFAGN
jgi:hypothetical protein